MALTYRPKWIQRALATASHKPERQSVRKSITEILDTASGATCVSEIPPLFGAENK